MRTLLLVNLILVPAAALAGQAPAPQQSATPSYKRDVPAALAAEAKIAEDSAIAIALARVPGQIAQLVLEREAGRLLYSFDIKVPGKPGIEEVHVDALNGRILRVEHEP